MITNYKSINDALLAAYNLAPNKGYIFLDKSNVTKLSYKELYEQSQCKALNLSSVGIEKDSRVLLMLDKGPEFTIIYYGLLLCGAVPCVLSSIGSFCNNEVALSKLKDIICQLDATHVISSQKIQENLDGVICLTTDCLNHEISGDFTCVSNEIALIQTSSGTTGKPKCLGLSQINVLSNLEQMRQRLKVSFGGDDVMVSWLPLYHDMGLVGCFLSSMYGQIDCVQMSTFQFLRRPESWLEAISDYRGTLSSVPNFAYALTANRTPDKVVSKLDLSCWRSAMCGAEQINYETLIAFAKKFEFCGFNSKAFTSCYGLAEATIGVSMDIPGEGLIFEHLNRKELTEKGQANLSDTVEDMITIVGCGKPFEGTSVQIRDDVGMVLDEGHLGELWVSGPSVIDGYLGLPEENKTKFVDGWFDTGDLAYLRNGHLFITGRKKELIIIRGHNYAPTEFEWIAGEVSGVATGKIVAFGLFDETSATESLYIVFERDKKLNKKQSDASLAETVKLHVAKKLGALATVEVLPKNTITKTTSGKLQRTKVAEMFAMRELV